MNLNLPFESFLSYHLYHIVNNKKRTSKENMGNCKEIEGMNYRL